MSGGREASLRHFCVPATLLLLFPDGSIALSFKQIESFGIFFPAKPISVSLLQVAGAKPLLMTPDELRHLWVSPPRVAVEKPAAGRAREMPH